MGVGCWLVSSGALAQSGSGRASAVQAFDHASELMSQGKIAEACPLFAASFKLDPQLGAALHLADCHAKNGQLASAWSTFKDAEEMARARGDDRAAFAHDQLAQLQPRLNRLTISAPSSPPPGLEVRVDGVVLPAALWGTGTPVDPGRHVVELRAPGYMPWSSTLQVVGEAQRVSVVGPMLQKAQPGTAAAAAGPTAPSDGTTSALAGGPITTDAGVSSRSPGSTNLQLFGWVGVGAGVAGLGLGTLFLIKKNATVEERDKICPGYRECTLDQASDIRTHTNDASRQLTMSAIGFAAGGLLAAGGVMALVLSSKQRSSADQAAFVAPVVGPGTLGLSGAMKW